MKKQILFLTLCIALLLSGCQKTPEALPAVQAEETPWKAESQDSQSSYNDLTQEPRPQVVRKIYGEEDGAAGLCRCEHRAGRADGRGRRMGLFPQRI